jgi:hypothetical protein
MRQTKLMTNGVRRVACIRRMHRSDSRVLFANTPIYPSEAEQAIYLYKA